MRSPFPAALLAAALAWAVTFAGTAAAENATVTVRGAVRLPGAYELRQGETISSLLVRAGGFTDNASLRGAVLTRESERRRQAWELRELLSGIRASLREAPGDPGEKEAFLAGLARLSPQGRVPVRLSHPRLMQQTDQDIRLEPGDDLFVPEEAGTVRVTGAVRAAGEFPAAPGKRYLHYVEAAGGFAAGADRRGAFALRADGSAAPLYEPWIRWNPSEDRLEFAAFRKDRPPIAGGDTIVVPEGLAAAPWLDAVRNYRHLLLRIAVLTGLAGAR